MLRLFRFSLVSLLSLALLPIFASPVTETIYTHVISEDGKRVAARLGSAVWGKLDAFWTPVGRKKENGLGLEPPKPFLVN